MILMRCLAIVRTSRKNLLMVSCTFTILLYFYMCPEIFHQTQLNSEETLIGIIILDTDVMFNQNIQELWNMFDLFNDEQAIGGIFEQLDNLQNNMATARFPILKAGINSGVLLLQLDRMRQLNWAQLWRSVGEQMQNDEGGVNFGEQGIINTILYRKPNLLFEIPFSRLGFFVFAALEH
ncbi:unnamed protein product [Calicophoron daubneyi]|uniref:UDP-D-xylose:beta-D-glucoside alpha-1,3-D-xylosyltransferase n=1 Tax=Calicophoron daubneyi TaxID=300641 RepID=A0AAV2TSH2_CALDB